MKNRKISLRCGIMPQTKILHVLEKYGKVELIEFDYARFKSNNNGKSKMKRQVKEQLYVLTKSNDRKRN